VEAKDAARGGRIRQGGHDHAAGIRVSTIPAYQLAPKGMTLSSKL
jgi:hypothetical protein